MNKLMLYILLLLTHVAHGSVTISSARTRYNVKINLFDLTQIYNNSARISLEYTPLTRNYSLEPELGYFFFSREDEIRCRGLHTALSAGINAVMTKFIFGLRLQPFYDKIYMDGYLKYDTEYHTFYEYRKTRYVKERYGINFIQSGMFQLSKRIALELNLGLGIIHYTTLVPDKVVQKHYNNGYSTNDRFLVPTDTRKFTSTNLITVLKLGYRFN